MNLFQELQYKTLQYQTRRHFLRQCTSGLGAIAFGSLMGCNPFSSSSPDKGIAVDSNDAIFPHFAPKAKRVIYLHMAGSPSQLELFDYKPELAKLHNQDCPASWKARSLPLFRECPKCWALRQNLNSMGSQERWFPITFLILLPS
jgi:hypothetical protein